MSKNLSAKRNDEDKRQKQLTKINEFLLQIVVDFFSMESESRILSSTKKATNRNGGRKEKLFKTKYPINYED